MIRATWFPIFRESSDRVDCARFDQPRRCWRAHQVAPSKDDREDALIEVHMSALRTASGIALALSVASLACTRQDSPTAPASARLSSGAPTEVGTGPSVSGESIAVARLHPVLGSGSGIVKVTPTSNADGSFSAQININVHGAPGNTVFYIQRAPEVGRVNGADGICQRADGLAPWGPPAPNFITFPLPATGPLLTLETSNGGAGSTHLDFAASIPDGTQFDVMFRLVDNLTNPTIELRTGCFTVTVR